MDSSSNIKRDNHDSDDVDMAISLSSAPCPSSLVKESLKRNITARLSLNRQNSLDYSSKSPLDNLSNFNLGFGSSLQKSSKDDSSSGNLLSNIVVNSNGKF